MSIDFKSFSPNGPSGMENFEWRRWWTLKQDELPEAISRVIGFLHSSQTGRMTQLDMGTRLYGNVSLMGLNGLSYSRLVQRTRATTDRLTYNVIQSAIDTLTSKIGKNKPRPLFLTSGGDWRQQQKAKNLGKFVDGIFYENDAYHQGSIMFRDACIWGTGITHVYNHYGRVKHENVIPHEIYIDEVEAARRNPRQLHRVKIVDRMQLADMFPSSKKKILQVASATYDEVGAYQHVSDVVVVRESWHLPSGPDAKDGLHIITIDNALLLHESWDKNYFPFAFFHWNPRPIGFWGQSVCEEIQPDQLEINKALWVLTRSYHLAGSFKILLANGSKIVKEHLTNDVGAIINYTGTPPQYITPPIVPVEYYQHIESMIQRAFTKVGVSMLSAGSMKPQGLDSGKALREYNDIESDRFMTVGRFYQKYYLDLAKLDIQCAKEIYEEEGDYSVYAIHRNSTVKVDWSSVDLAEDQYVMKEYPTSTLPQDPEGRLQTIQEYAQAGMMSLTTARRLLDFPDLEQVESLQNASEEYLNKILEEIVNAEEDEDGNLWVPKTGREVPFIMKQPEPFDDLQLARELGLQYYAQGKTNELEESKLALIRQFIQKVELLQGQAMAPVMGGAVAGAPPANPESAPVSDLLPNAPAAGMVA